MKKPIWYILDENVVPSTVEDVASYLTNDGLVTDETAAKNFMADLKGI